MTLKLHLQSVSEWVSTIAKAAGDVTSFAVEAGYLQDTLSEICDRAGVAGAVFKLGAMAIPKSKLETDAEIRIAAHLARTFVKTLNDELATTPPSSSGGFGFRGEPRISKDTWKRYQKEHLDRAAAKTLASKFTWLKVIGQSGRKSSRSWPIVHELADFARAAVWGAATLDLEPDADPGDDLRRFADDVRGNVHDALARTVDELVDNPLVNSAFNVELPQVTRDALQLVAERFELLDRSYLFDEIPQDKLFIPPTIRLADYSKEDCAEDWEKVDPVENGDDVLLDRLTAMTGRSAVIVIEGEMGVGKSCLMRRLAAQSARRFRSERKDAVLYVNWRDIYEANSLTTGIADYISHQYGVPLPNLDTEERLVIFVDGFDEMRSHDPARIASYFRSLVTLARKHKSPVVLAMRSTVRVNELVREWKDSDVLVANVDEFSNEDIDTWANNWQEVRDTPDITGEDLRGLCSGQDELVRNPLLLFMLARYVQPTAKFKGQPLSRAEIFRTFVDETITGKARRSGQRAGITVNERNYRCLLQEIAWTASWPNHGGKCRLSAIRDRYERELQDLALDDFRSAFVLHFFEPGDNDNEFQFHPEGFRHYLLAEWCVRTQCEVMLNDRRAPEYPTGRSRDEAINALAQFPLREVERDLINELYEQLSDESTRRALGLEQLDVEKLYEFVRDDASDPPNIQVQPDTRVGVPDGHVTSMSLASTRQLCNYWDYSLLACLALFRGLKRDRTEPIFAAHPDALLEFLSLHIATRGQQFTSPFSLRAVGLGKIQLMGVQLSAADLNRADLNRANLIGANLNGADLRGAVLDGAEVSGAGLRRADLNEAILNGADLNGADLMGADLKEANLNGADLNGADLREANLLGANLSGANLNGADLNGADLNRADLNGARLIGARLIGAHLNGAHLSGALTEGAIGLRVP